MQAAVAASLSAQLNEDIKAKSKHCDIFQLCSARAIVIFDYDWLIATRLFRGDSSSSSPRLDSGSLHAKANEFSSSV
jgi:hypothetical protein